MPALDSSPLFIVQHGRSLKPILATHFYRFFKSCITTVGLEPDSFHLAVFVRVVLLLLSIAALLLNLSRSRDIVAAMRI